MVVYCRSVVQTFNFSFPPTHHPGNSSSDAISGGGDSWRVGGQEHTQRPAIEEVVTGNRFRRFIITTGGRRRARQGLVSSSFTAKNHTYSFSSHYTDRTTTATNQYEFCFGFLSRVTTLTCATRRQRQCQGRTDTHVHADRPTTDDSSRTKWKKNSLNCFNSHRKKKQLTTVR